MTQPVTELSDIQALAEQIQRLDRAVNSWNKAMLWGLVITVLAAVVVLVTTRMVVLRTGQLSEAQEKLSKAKESQLSLDLREKDVKIANANERAAGLEVEALELRKQLQEQGPRAYLLTGDKRRKLVEALKPFAGQKIDVRYSAATIMVNGAVVMSSPMGDDALGLAKALIGVLKDAGWNAPSTPLIGSLQGEGIEVEVLPASSNQTRMAAHAIVEALRKVSIAASDPTLTTDALGQRVGKENIVPPFDSNTIVLVILTHPSSN
jgi:hypothetical protein